MDTASVTLAALRASYGERKTTPTAVARELYAKIEASESVFNSKPTLEDVLERCKYGWCS
jgi:hypothetical protein